MKILEPINSALLITGCIYAAGISQNNAFMRAFGVNPEFSQPSLDKILYDGGLITFEIFYRDLIRLSFIIISAIIILSGAALLLKKKRPQNLTDTYRKAFKALKIAYQYFPLGIALLIYIVYLCFASYRASQEIGNKLAETFIYRCHKIVITKDKETSITGCAFRKDKDSIWYYNKESGSIKVGSKLLTELSQVSYLDPQNNSVSSKNKVN